MGETHSPSYGIFSLQNDVSGGRWTQEDSVKLATLRLLGPAKAFYNSNLDLHAADVTWERFKGAFREMFRDVCPDQFYFSKLQLAKQERNEGSQEFADRCRNLA